MLKEVRMNEASQLNTAEKSAPSASARFTFSAIHYSESHLPSGLHLTQNQ
jgi:hypothetical protein